MGLMSTKNKKALNEIKRGIALSYILIVLNMIIQLVYTPIMIRLLGQSEYGLYTLVGSVVNYLGLFGLGFTGAYLKFFSSCKQNKEKDSVACLNGMFLVVFIGMSIVSLICGMGLSFFSENIFGARLDGDELKEATVLMRILVINISMSFPSSLLDSMISAHEQFTFQRLLAIASLVFNPFITLPLLIMGYGTVAMVIITTIISSVKLLVSLWFCLWKLKVPFKFSNFSMELLRKIAGFSFFIFLNMIIDQVNWSVDKLILGRISGTVAVAIYGVGAQINSLYIQFSTAISSVFCPRVNRIAAEKREDMNEEFTSLFIQVGRIQFIVLGLIATGLITFGKYFITKIYVTEEYAETYPVMLLLIIPASIPLIQNLGIEIQRAKNQHWFRSIVYMGMAVINVVVSIPLAREFGPIGCAMGTAGSLLIANGLIMNVYYQIHIKINIIQFWKNILSLGKGMVIPGILSVGIMKLVNYNGISEFVLWIILYIIVYVTSVWFLGMNIYEKKLIKSIIEQVCRRG